MVRLPDQLPFDGYLLSGSVCDDCSHTLLFSRVKHCTASVSFPMPLKKRKHRSADRCSLVRYIKAKGIAMTDFVKLLTKICRFAKVPGGVILTPCPCEICIRKMGVPLCNLTHRDCEIIFIIKQNRNQFFCPHFPLSVKAFSLPNATVSTSRRLSSENLQ